MTAIHSSPATVVQRVLDARSPAASQPSSPTNVNVYAPAICARFAMTITSAAMIPHPPSQPVIGPNARVAQVNVVPQSGSARFSSW